MKKYVPYAIVAVFGGVAYYLWRKEYVATNGVAPGRGAVDPPPVLGGFSGTASRTSSVLDLSSGPAGFPSAQTANGYTKTSGGFTGTAAMTLPVPPSTGPSVESRSGRAHF